MQFWVVLLFCFQFLGVLGGTFVVSGCVRCSAQCVYGGGCVSSEVQHESRCAVFEQHNAITVCFFFRRTFSY